ncbi:MAG: glycosyl hydrolase [bacterium]|nr:glycosyl hydrolase [bacterium]
MQIYFRLFLLVIISLSISTIVFGLAKYEPSSGCYLGAYIEADPVAPGNIYAFETATQKKHACYMIYAGWGSGFPTAWAQNAKIYGAAVQIAFAPNNFGLDSVVDGPYIRKWAQAAHTLRMPVFVRWASEMNLSEFNWSGDTAKYVNKWRLLYNIFKEEAPNIAMVWAPNWSPTSNIPGYYPGDEYVDWIGVDMYMGLGTGTTDQTDPRTKIQYVYNFATSHRKPIMLPEWAACHAYSKDSIAYDCTAYGIEKMNLIYDHLQAEFPNLKLVTWFDWDTRSINNADFSLTNNYAVLTNYRRAISSQYYLTSISLDTALVQIHFSNITANQVISGNRYITATTSFPVSINSIVFWINTTQVSRLTTTPYQYYWSTEPFIDGEYQLKVQVYAANSSYDYDQIDVVLDKSGDYVNLILDNNSPGFTTTGGGWWLSSSQGDRYGANYYCHNPGSGTAKAIWRPTIPNPGFYDVYAWWSIHSNRATNAPYTINYFGGITTIRVNQEVNGGQWNLLGKFYFSAGTTGTVTLSDDANDIVIADAVRFMKNANSSTALEKDKWILYE